MIYHLRLNGPTPLIYEFADFTDTAKKLSRIKSLYVRSVADNRFAEVSSSGQNKQVPPETFTRKLRLAPISASHKDFVMRETLEECKLVSSHPTV